MVKRREVEEDEFARTVKKDTEMIKRFQETEKPQQEEPKQEG